MKATKAAIEKNYPFLCSLESWWNMILKYGDTEGYIRRARDCLHGAAMYAAFGSEHEEELLFLRDLLIEQRDVYERMEAKEAA